MSIFDVRCETPFPQQIVRDFESRAAFIDEDIVDAKVSPDGTLVRVRLRPAAGPDRRAAIESRLHALMASMRSALVPRVRVIEQARTGPPGCGCDLDDLLLREHDITEEVPGVAVLGPRLAALVDTLDAQLRALVGRLGAVPYRFPALIDARTLERLHAFQYFPHTLGFASHLRRDADALAAFSKTASAGPAGVEVPEGTMASPAAMLTPAVCYHLYRHLAGRTLPGGALVATTMGKCFRHESSNLTSLERLWDFTVRELVFVGSSGFVREGRDAIQRSARDWFASLGLDHHLETAHDHFFGDAYARQPALQSAFELKVEVRATLPHKQGTLAVASYNHHQDFFGRAMDIRLPDGSTAHTACAGFGLERLAYALASQYGLERDRWPAPLRGDAS